MPAPSLPEVLALLRAVLERDFPESRPHEISVRDRDGREEARLPLPRGRTQVQVSDIRDATPPPATVPRSPTRHSEDFRSVHWFGTDHTFSPTQSHIIQALWTAWEAGTPDVGQDTLLEAAGSQTRNVRDLFRDHAALDTMIVATGSRGARTFRLNEP